MTELTVRLVVSLAIVLGLLLLCARFAGRRFQGRRDALVQVVHRQQIGRHASVSVVNVSGRLLVLGTTDQEVRLLTELDPDELAEDDEPAEAVPAQLPVAGDPMLTLLHGGETAAATSPTSTAGPASPASVARALEVLESAKIRSLHPTPTPAPAPRPGRRRADVPVSTELVGPAALLFAEEPRHAVLPELPETLVDDLIDVPAEVSADVRPGRHTAPKPGARRAAAPGARKAASRRTSGKRGARTETVTPKSDDSALAGSVLSPRTWKQAWGAVTGQAS
ncbi:MAG TPA: hypothetical protein DEQ43_07250 [Nocardioides bacterium]|uniref:FliO/MopB family protein n=1 Tax=uncultured Nocardioides sp. TaxID=198441 RepID=UPI000EEB69AC|nr:flagellar biosynthetic protein FliO [uncultured Nocardioides sp.]HCB04028.1 hypothetical protein [Nocardioides sp.]